MIKKKLILALLGIPLYVGGQFYSGGEDPASVKWERIRTENFKLIYPEGFYEEANRFANLLEFYRPYTSYTLRKLPARIPVVIHNRSLLSNGFVSWAPKRMEIVALPDQGHFNQDWFELLALHEYRHVVQVDKFRQGITRGLSWIFGEIAVGASSAFMTQWFLEGDAVAAETALSSSGRGRLPSFDMELRAAVLDSLKNLSYDQVFLGSYKRAVPDHYQCGYHMVSYARIKKGPGFWNNAINYAARNPYVLAPLSLYSMKNIGMNRERLYRMAMDSLRCIWQEVIKDVDHGMGIRRITRPDAIYRQYKWPQSLSDRRIIALKTGIDLLDQIVCIDSSGKEKKLLETGTTMEWNLSAGDHTVIWDEIVGDPRWERRNYSVIKAMSLQSGKVNTLTHRTRYFSPDISGDETKVIAVEADIENNYFLVSLQYPEAKLLKRFPSPGNKTLQHPEWIDDHRVVLVSFNGKEKAIELVNTLTGEWKTVFHAGNTDISEPAGWKDYYLFRASRNGTDNIYAIDRDGTVFQVTYTAYGAYFPSVTRDSACLVYSCYTPGGFALEEIQLDTGNWTRVSPEDDPVSYYPWAKKLKAQEPAFNREKNEVPYQFYDRSAYRKTTHLFNFHSWLPFYLDMDENNLSLDITSLKPGFMLFSQNLLSTALTTISYRYEEGYHIFRPSFTFRGWYPVFNVTAEIGGPVTVLPYPEDVEIPDLPKGKKEYTLKAYVPLFFTQNNYLKLIQPQLEYRWSNTLYYNDIFKSGLGQWYGRLYLYRYLRYTHRDLYPKWGQLFSFVYTGSPGDDNQFGTMGAVQLSLYFPGFYSHHSLNLNGGYQKQWPGRFYLPLSPVAFPRGYTRAVAEEFTRFSANYSFPFLYPEYSLGWFLYIKRLKANLFYDLSFGKNIQKITNGSQESYTGRYSSAGVEIYMDLHLLRIMFPIQTGLRYSYLPFERKHDVEWLFSVNTNIF